MRYLLDTNVCIDYLTARYPPVIGRLQRVSPEDLCVSSIAAAELRYGADKSGNPSRNHARLDVLFAEMRCLSLEVGAVEAPRGDGGGNDDPEENGERHQGACPCGAPRRAQEGE